LLIAVNNYLDEVSLRFTQVYLSAALICVMLEAIGDGARLGLTGIDGPDLVVLKPEGKGVNTLFWNILGNRLIFYYYASAHVVLWLGMLPRGEPV